MRPESVKDIQGVWVALVTPWDEDRAEPRREALRSLIMRFVSVGVDGLFVLGTTGEGFLFSVEERKIFLEVILEEVNGRLPVIVHVGHELTKVAVDLARHAQKVGARAVSLTPPSRYRLDWQELEDYFVAVAEAVSDLPVLLYDIPSGGCNALGATLLAQVHERASNIVGAKVSRSDWSAWEEYLRLAGSLVILVGNDLMCFPLILSGAVGIVSGPANVFPEFYVELFRRIKEKDVEGALRCQSFVNRLCQILHYGQPLAYIKDALQKLGWEVGEVRRPLRALSLEEQEQLRAALVELARAWENELAKRR